MRYQDIEKRKVNAIRQRLSSAIFKYSFDEVRTVSNRYFNEVLEKIRLKKEIAEKEKELDKLKKSKG